MTRKTSCRMRITSPRKIRWRFVLPVRLTPSSVSDNTDVVDWAVAEEMELDPQPGPGPASALRIRLKVNNDTESGRPSRAAPKRSGKRTKRVALEVAMGGSSSPWLLPRQLLLPLPSYPVPMVRGLTKGV